MTALNKFKKFFKNIGDKIKPFFNKVKQFFSNPQNIINTVKTVKDVITTVKDPNNRNLNTLLNNVVPKLTPTINTFVPGFENVTKTVTPVLNKLIQLRN
jgi:phage-related protein